MTHRLLLLLFMAIALMPSLLMADDPPSEDTLRRINWVERELIANIPPFVFDVYVQHQGPTGTIIGDHFIGGWAQLAPEGIMVTEFSPPALARRRKPTYATTGFVQVLFPDLAGIDQDYYTWQYRGQEFLNDLRCWLFDLAPTNSAVRGAFVGRIWVAQSDLGIIRFDGTYTHGPRLSPYLHFVSTRVKSGPNGLWLPATVHIEEHDLDRRMPGVHSLTARVNVWGYHRRATQGTEATTLRVLPSPGVASSGPVPPIPAPHEWYHAIEESVTAWLEAAGLLAPDGNASDEIEGVIQHLVATSLNTYAYPIHARLLLTTTLEVFTLGDTIVLSKGLLDALRNENDLALVLATPVAHVLLDHHIDTRYGFHDLYLGELESVVRRLSFQHTPKEKNDAAVLALDLLTKSTYRGTLADAAVFLQGIAAACPQRTALFQARWGDPLPGCGGATALQRLLELAPRHPTAIPANALGSRVVVDPWTSNATLVEPRLEPAPFGIIPLIPTPREAVQEQREGIVLPPVPRPRRPALPALR